MVPTTVIDALAKAAQEHTELHWMALIDAAFDYPGNDAAPYRSQGQGINCYAIQACQGLEKAAPWLLPLGWNEPDQAQLRTLIRHCTGRPMLSVIASDHPPQALKEQWKNLHWATDADGQRMLLRFADTRVLPVLPQVLTPEQWAAWTAPLAQWWTIDRSGKPASCPLAARDVAPCSEIALTQAQLNQLLQAAEPDAVIQLLKEKMSDIVPKDLLKSRLHDMIAASCALAQAHGIDNFSDVVALAVAACLTKGNSNHDPRLPLLLREREWQTGELGEKLVDAGVVQAD